MDASEIDVRLKNFRSGPLPPCARHLGFEFLEGSIEQGWVRGYFLARPEFANPMGNVQGGFISAMLDDAMAVAGLLKSNFTQVMPTLEMKTSFLAPAKVGRLCGEGRVLKLGKSVAFLEGRLTSLDGVVIAVASATARPAAAPWLAAAGAAR